MRMGRDTWGTRLQHLRQPQPRAHLQSKDDSFTVAHFSFPPISSDDRSLPTVLYAIVNHLYSVLPTLKLI